MCGFRTAIQIAARKAGSIIPVATRRHQFPRVGVVWGLGVALCPPSSLIGCALVPFSLGLRRERLLGRRRVFLVYVLVSVAESDSPKTLMGATLRYSQV
jgi:hypothetical protein